MTTTSLIRRNPGRHRGRGIAVGAALLLVLAACGDPDTVLPVGSPTSSTAPATTTPGGTTPGESTPTTPVDTLPGTPTTMPTTAPPTNPPTPTTDPRSERAFDVDAARSELDAARQRWAEQGFRSYTFDYSLSCFCPPTAVRVAVIEGLLVETTLDGGYLDDTYVGLTVVDWFDEIEWAIDNAYLVDVTYEDGWGYPTSVYIDLDDMIADEESGMSFEGFFHRPAPISNLVNQPYGCGYGFWTATPTQGVSLRLGFYEAPEAGSFDVADLDEAELLIGQDLMSNWCDDVMEEGEPEPRVDQTWPITAGTLEISFEGSTATATITELVATAPGGDEVPLGDTVITNEFWGTFAG